MKMKFLLMLLAAVLPLQHVLGQDDETPAKKHRLRLPCLVGNYFTLEGGMGLQGMNYDLLQAGATGELKYGIDLKAGLRHYFAPHSGIGVGLRFQDYVSSATMNFMQSQSGALDFYEQPRSYTYRTYYNVFEERQSVTMLEIPVEIFFQTNITGRLKLNLGAGLQANFFAVQNKYENTGGKITTKAYYEQWDLELEDMARYRLYDTTGFTGKYDYKISFSAIGEAGFMYALTSKWEIMLNFQATYGLSSVMDNYAAHYVYDPECVSKEDGVRADYKGTYNGLMTTQAENAKFLSVGATIGFRYRIAIDNPQVAMEFDEALHKARRLKATEDEDLNLIEALDADEVERRRRRRDTVALDDKENQRKKRDIESDEFFINDQGDTVWVNPVEPVVVDTQKVEVVDTQKVVVVDTAKIKEPEPEPVFNVKDTLQMLLNILNDNYCDLNSVVPKTARHSKELDRLAALLKEYPEIELDAIGHTCTTGSIAHNKTLGMERAKAIKAELTKRGVPQSRIHCITRWFTEPRYPNTTEENRMKNRRYELKEHVKQQ